MATVNGKTVVSTPPKYVNPKSFVWKKTPQGFIEPSREKYLAEHPAPTGSPVSLTPENIQAIEKSGGIQAGSQLAKTLAGRPIQVVQMRGGQTPQSAGFDPNAYYNFVPVEMI